MRTLSRPRTLPPLLLALLLAGCPEPGVPAAPVEEPAQDPGVDVPAQPEPEWHSCTNPVAGYTVSFPGNWHTNDGDVMAPCSLFDPQPIQIDPATEIPADIAVVIRLEEIDFESVASLAPGQEEMLREGMTVDGRTAQRVEVRLIEDQLRPAGTRTYQVIVDMNGQTLIAEATDIGQPPYEERRSTLDEMMETLRFEEDLMANG